MKNESLSRAMRDISDNPNWRAAFVRCVLDFEREVSSLGIDVRETITGPLIDALYNENQIVTKSLLDGTTFEFLYRTKIARDFIMSEPSIPDHVWEPQTTRLLTRLSSGARHIVVGGAYFGDQSILIAKEAAKSGGLVHAFEPNIEQRNMLIKNAKLNRLNNIIMRSEGLWNDSQSHLKLVGYDSFAHPEVALDDQNESFETITIDDYLRATNADHLDLIMLDIEGAELRALIGAEKFLLRPLGDSPSIVFEVHRDYVNWDNGLENTEIIRFLSECGYEVFAIRDFNSNFNMAGRPIEIIPAKDVYLEGPNHGFNMVAVKDTNLFYNSEFLICHGVSPKLLRHKDPSLHHPLGGL